MTQREHDIVELVRKQGIDPPRISGGKTPVDIDHAEKSQALLLNRCLALGWAVKFWPAAYDTGVWAAVMVSGGNYSPESIADATTAHDDQMREEAEGYLQQHPELPIVQAGTFSEAVAMLEHRLRALGDAAVQRGSAWAGSVADHYDRLSELLGT
jgi:hypothetical protein